MTDKAEERIWAWEYKGHTPWGPIKPDLDVVTNGAEYIRADIHQALEAERDKLKKALTAIIPMTDEIAKAPMTAERWAERIEDVARAALGETEND